MATVLRMKKEGSCGSADSLLPNPEGKDRGLVESENHTKSSQEPWKQAFLSL